MGGLGALVRKGVEKGDNMLSAGVVGGKGGYMGQKLDFVSRSLSITAGRFNNFKSRMTIIP